MGNYNGKNNNIESDMIISYDLQINKIIEEVKLNLLINNKVIMKEDIIERLIKLYNGYKNEKMTILFNILFYVWLLKDEKLLLKLKNELSFINEPDKELILKQISINSINLDFECLSFNTKPVINIFKISLNLNHISNLKSLNLCGIIHSFYVTGLEMKE